jgi:hypothetical protein
MKAVKLLAAIVMGTILLAVAVACAAAQPISSAAAAVETAATAQLMQPLGLLVDTSSTNNQPAARMQQRSQIESLLSFVPPGVPFAVISFNRSATLVHRGVLSTADAMNALAQLDTVKRAGPTDLGAAFDLLHKQPGFARANAVILSDFYLDPPARSPWAHADLYTLLKTANNNGIDHMLLVPIGAYNKVALNDLPTCAEVLHPGQGPSPWLQRLMPLPPPHPPQKLPPWYRGGSFLFSAVLVVLLVGGARVAHSRQQKFHRIELERMKITAPARSNQIEEPAIRFIDTSAPPRIRTRPGFVALLLERGREIVLHSQPVLIGASPLAVVYVPDAATTLQLTAAPDGSSCAIKNVGARDVYIGQHLVPRGASVRLQSGFNTECALAPGTTLSVYTAIEEAA